MPPIRPYPCLVPPPPHPMLFAWPDMRPAEYAALLASIRDRADDLGGDVVAEAGESGLRLEIEVPS